MRHLMSSVSRVRPRVYRSSADDAQNDDWVVYAVESVYEHHVASLNSSMSEASDEFADENFGLRSGHVVGRVEGVNVDLTLS